MTTVRQIERLWNAKDFSRLARELLVARPDSFLRLEVELSKSVTAAALGLIRLDELSQNAVPLYGKLLRTMLGSQGSDGGWGDPITTAICLRALLCGQGDGLAIERGLIYLANLQKPEGIWPGAPLRRMPAEPFVSAYILFQLGDRAQFRQNVRFNDAVTWFLQNESELEDDAAKLWDLARARCGKTAGSPAPAEAHLWC